MPCSKLWSKHMCEKVIETYRELPEQDRTSKIVADRLETQGYLLDASRVRQVLEATVLAKSSLDAIQPAREGRGAPAPGHENGGWKGQTEQDNGFMLDEIQRTALALVEAQSGLQVPQINC